MAGCNCGKPAVPASQEYTVIAADGKEYTEQSEPAARIKATQVNGRVTVKKK